MSQLIVFGVCAAGLTLLACSATAIRYRIFDGRLEITWLLFTLRRIRLDEIKYISTRPVWYAEKWHNTLLPGNRRLTLYRRNGLKRPVSISPRNPFVFKAELDQAIARFTAGKIKVIANIYSDSKLESAHRA